MTASRGRLYVLHPHITGKNAAAPAVSDREPQSRLEEALSLAHAIDVDVAGGMVLGIRTIRPATYIGRGQLDDLGERLRAIKASVVVFNCALSPIQQRNLERELKLKVIDRTALILEIFGARAQTREGELQVALAHLSYQRSRLVRSWTHLERQRGGGGFLGGPGETQIEADRRIIAERISRLKRQLEAVRRTRGQHRKQRQRAPYPVIALVGYTNAGKSTLFNRLTGADVMAEDLLFATLDPTLRAVTLSDSRKIILSDTVGFIADLPTQLIAAFRATLEEVLEADIILHIRDISHPDSDAQAADVYRVLQALGIERSGEDAPLIIEIFNKIDQASAEQSRSARAAAAGGALDTPLVLSALTGEGLAALEARLCDALGQGDWLVEIWIPHSAGQPHAQIRATMDVLTVSAEGEGLSYRIKTDPIAWGRFEKSLARSDFG